MSPTEETKRFIRHTMQPHQTCWGAYHKSQHIPQTHEGGDTPVSIPRNRRRWRDICCCCWTLHRPRRYAAAHDTFAGAARQYLNFPRRHGPYPLQIARRSPAPLLDFCVQHEAPLVHDQTRAAIICSRPAVGPGIRIFKSLFALHH